MNRPQAAIEYLKRHRRRHVQQLLELLRFESISADPSYADQMTSAAKWLEQHCRRIGLECRLFEIEPAPILLAWKQVDPALPTVLVYGHYDVQPPGDETEWRSPPFEPTIVDGSIIARGAADNKGPFMVYLGAVEAYLATDTALPVNVKILIEGQEETASEQLEQFVRSNRELLACDQIVISDTCQYSADLPAITYGTRGLVYKEIHIRGARNDLHSGGYGGAVPNPCNILCHIIGQLQPPAGKINIDGFYDDVLELDPQERQDLENLPSDPSRRPEGLGVKDFLCEPGYSPRQGTWTRPTLDVNGLWGGYSGPGSKTVLPAKAGAKLSMRLVPNQDAADISEKFDRALRKLCPQAVELEIITTGLANPYLAPREGAGITAARRAIQKAFGTQPVLVREGGTLPILPVFHEQLGCHCLLIGLAMPDSNAHGPNEFFRLVDFYRGMEMAAYLFDEMSKAQNMT